MAQNQRPHKIRSTSRTRQSVGSQASSGSHAATPASQYSRSSYSAGSSYTPVASQQSTTGFRPNSHATAGDYRNKARYTSSGGVRGGSAAPKKKGGGLKKALLTVLVLVLIGGGVFAWLQLRPIKVSINGVEYEVGKTKDIAAAIEASDTITNPGNLIAVDESVIEKGQGWAFDATINDELTHDETAKLKNGDVVTITNGSDIMEEFTTTEESIPTETYMEDGYKAFHVITGTGEEGIRTTRTGNVSGISVSEVTREPSNVVCEVYDVDTGGDKVIAITFDDGPWGSTTQQILDILAANDAKATFFVIGNQVEDDPDIVKAEYEAGHQVCTHTYDHAEGSGRGVNLGYMSADEQVEEVEKGIAAIEEAIGTKLESRVMRAPGGNFDEDVFMNLLGHISADILWNVDTEDWRRPGSSAIYSQIMNAGPGDVILCHDGGGDRSQTVEAVRQAIPDKIAQGYKFITIDEMLKYPRAS